VPPGRRAAGEEWEGGVLGSGNLVGESWLHVRAVFRMHWEFYAFEGRSHGGSNPSYAKSQKQPWPRL
jgi:hypothetical protein